MDALQNFLNNLSTMTATERVSVMRALGMDPVRLAQFVQNLSSNVPMLQRLITTAEGAEGSLERLSNERFTTTRNHLILLMNNVRDMAIAFGEGLGIDKATGSLDKFIDRVIDFLQNHRDDFVNMGREFGRFLDNLDMNRIKSFLDSVVTIGKIIYGTFKTTFDLLASLPAPIQMAGCGRWAGGGSTTTFSNCQKRPSCDQRSSEVQALRSTASDSSNRASASSIGTQKPVNSFRR